MGILENLNENQKKAAEKIEGPLLILAGAGSGKTRTITYKIAHMIKEKDISPHNILAVTFTNKAASEMKERVSDLIDGNNAVTISTFHSFGVKLLRMYSNEIGFDSNFNIYDGADQKSLIRKILKQQNQSDLFTPSKALGKISKLKEEGIFPRQFEEMVGDFTDKIILEIYREYQKELRHNNSIDFADILIYTNLLLDDEKILEKIQNRYLYIMVDEYQDTNKIQYEIVKKIAAKNRNICVVGDEDQSIYGFRGADIRNILNFEKDYPEATTIRLEQNYRSTEVILETANSVIKSNNTSLGKRLWTENKRGTPIKVYEAESEKEEASYINREIKDLIKDGHSYKDITILYRTNAQSRNFEEVFLKENIPYKIFGGIQFYQRKEIKDIIAYLNVINNVSDNYSLTRIINVPGRKIGNKTLEKIEEYANDNDVSMFEALNDVEKISGIGGKQKKSILNFYDIITSLRKIANEEPASEIFNQLLKNISYTKYLEDRDEKDKVENVYEFKNTIVEMEESEGAILLNDFLERLSLISAIDNVEESADYIKLMTIHNSKGLEFPVVFLVGLEEELFPGSRALDNEYQLEEERRLCYVGITRAEKKLYTTYARSRMVFGETTYMRAVSRFIEEMPQRNLSYEKIYMKPKGYKDNSVRTMADFKNKIKSRKKSDTGYSIGESVNHKKFGEGQIKNIEDNKLLIYFPGYGEKKFKVSIIKKFLV